MEFAYENDIVPEKINVDKQGQILLAQKILQQSYKAFTR